MNENLDVERFENLNIGDNEKVDIFGQIGEEKSAPLRNQYPDPSQESISETLMRNKSADLAMKENFVHDEIDVGNISQSKPERA